MRKIILSLALLAVSMTITAQNEVLTNSSITDMLELGFANDVIVTKINTSETNFDTSIQALKALKDKGVGNDVIVAMMNAGKQKADSNDVVNINQTGIFFKEGDEFKKIFPTAFYGTQTNTLGSTVSPNITNTKTKSIVVGEHSNNIIKTNIPKFYFRFNNVEQSKLSTTPNWWFSVASSPSEFVLVRLATKKGKRELGTGEIDLYSGNFKGVDSKDIVECNIDAISETEFMVTPQKPILPDEYCFFYLGAVTQKGFNNQAIFDFTISNDCVIENKYKVGDSVWVMKEGKLQKLEVMAVHVKKDGIYYSLRKRSSWKGEEYSEIDCFSSKEEITDLM